MSELGALLEFLLAHPRVLLFVLGWYLFNNVASSLPKPEEVAGAVKDRPITILIYTSIFHVAQGMAGNLARIIPQLRLGNGTEKENKS